MDEDVARKVAELLKPHKNKLEALYQFPMSASLIKDLQGIDKRFNGLGSKASLYRKTIYVREQMVEVLRACAEAGDERREVRIADWIKSWGRVRGEVALAKKALTDIENAGLEKVASWSKFAAFSRPRDYAILDSRVVYSLNWLLYQAQSDRYLPLLHGRNSLLDMFNYWPLIVFSRVSDLQARFDGEVPEGACGSIRSRFASVVQQEIAPQEGAYAWYVRELQLIGRGLYPEDDWALLKTEMLLFAGATSFILRDVFQRMAAASQGAALQH